MEEPIGDVEPEVIHVADEEFVERRLVDAGELGQAVDAQAALSISGADMVRQTRGILTVTDFGGLARLLT